MLPVKVREGVHIISNILKAPTKGQEEGHNKDPKTTRDRNEGKHSQVHKIIAGILGLVSKAPSNSNMNSQVD